MGLNGTLDFYHSLKVQLIWSCSICSMLKNTFLCPVFSPAKFSGGAVSLEKGGCFKGSSGHTRPPFGQPTSAAAHGRDILPQETANHHGFL